MEKEIDKWVYIQSIGFNSSKNTVGQHNNGTFQGRYKMEILKELQKYKNSIRYAIISDTLSLTYQQLWEKSEILASIIKGGGARPVIVYGHKNPYILVAFIACAKAGIPYVPIDINMPGNRIKNIIDSVEPRAVLTTEKLEQYKNYIFLDITEEHIYENEISIDERDWVKADDVFYIIFTSGSTGVPKGVQITYGALNYFTEWALSLGKCIKKNNVYINQAPFSFDLSVMDLYMSLSSESCLFTLSKEVQMDYKRLFASLERSQAGIWVSTPSFVEMCLAEPMFSDELLPELRQFLFCGETLTNKTVDKLQERFPGAQIYNMYGPTESTVAVTAILVDGQVNKKYQPLPVGVTKPGTVIKIVDEDGKEAGEGESGEITIFGNTVSRGYFNNPEENKRAFFEVCVDGETQRGYRTGDKGYMKEEMLFYEGRIDLQVKLHGYRIEVEDIEKNMMRIPRVEQAVVLPVYVEEKVKYLKAFCVYSGEIESTYSVMKMIKSELSKLLPQYMIPKKIVLIGEMPMTNNGKADRKKLGEL